MTAETARPTAEAERIVALDVLRRYGPLEWLWRVATYGRLFPLVEPR